MNPITLPLAELKPALTGLGKLLNRQAALPVLQCLRIERTADGWVCLTATDLERYATVRLEQPAKGEPCVLLAHFDDLVRVAKACTKNEHLLLEPASARSLTVRCDLAGQLGAGTIRSLPAEEFPAVPKIKGPAVPLPDALRRALQEAMECTSKDASRPVLQGALVDVSQPQAHYVVGTDGRHLFSCNSFQLPLARSLIIPRHKFFAWRDFHLDGDWQLRLPEPPAAGDADQRAYAQVSTRRWRLITPLIEMNYPNWRQVLPDAKAVRTTLEFEPASLDAVIRTVEMLADHDDQYHALGIEWRDRQVSFLYRDTPESTWQSVRVPGVVGEGKDVTVFCNRQLLLKALRFGLHTLSIVDEITALRFSNAGRQLIVMPVRMESGARASEPPPSRAAAPLPPPPPSPPAASVPSPLPSPPPPRQPHPLPNPASCSMKTSDTHPAPSPSPASQHSPSSDPPAPRVEEALELLDLLRDTCTKTLAQIKDLTTKLRLIQRGQRSSEREIQSVRQTLRSLQGIRF